MIRQSPSPRPVLNRRSFLGAAAAGAASFALSACTTVPSREPPPLAEPEPDFGNYASMYGPMFDEGYEIPAIPLERMDSRFLRQVVDDPTGERPGTIVVDTPNRFLYWVLEGGRAMRYGVGIGRDGFSWGGKGTIAYKREWPRWTPPAEMIVRQPELEIYRNGMEPGLENPLGARALYIFQNGQDTLYRLHGTLDVETIGKAVSSGCVRLLAQDVIDLYERVPNGSPIVVRQ